MDMPITGSKQAPKTFRGDSTEVDRFLRQYERLAILHSLSDEEKCDMVTEYCGRRVRETIEGFKAHEDKDWTTLRAKIRKTWNADLDSRRFRLSDLETWCRDAREYPIDNLRDWRNYVRRYTRIAGWLRRHGRLDERTYAYHFWMGIPRRFRQDLENILLKKEPDRNMSTPFDPTDVERTAEWLLGNERFDTESTLYPADLSDDEDRERRVGLRKKVRRHRRERRYEDSDSEDSDTEDELPRTRRTSPTTTPRVSSRLASPQPPTTSLPATTTEPPKANPDTQEFNQLMDQMRNLSLNDPQYSFLYVKMMHLDPQAARHLPEPIHNPPPRWAGPPPTRDPPPHILARPQPSLPPMRPPPPAVPPPSFTTGRPPPSTDGCYGCGTPGHMMSSCPQLQELIQKGVIRRDFRGRLVNQNGRLLRKEMNENWVQAIQRLTSEVHLITIPEGTAYVDEDDEDSNPVMVMAAERSLPQTRSMRRQAFDGVRVPPLDKGKQREQAPARNSPSASHQLPRITPVDPQPRRFNPDNDGDISMDWQTAPSQPTKNARTTASNPGTSSTKEASTKAPARRSQVAQEVDVDKITNTALQAPITITLKDLLGVSKDVSTRMQEILKVKKVETAQPTSTHLVTTQPKPLIRFNGTYNDHPIECIVDTGSQLNIISNDLCKHVIRRPIDASEPVIMNDANGGSSQLLGVVRNIPLHIGHITTLMDAHVAKDPPFEALLGRPWQANNMVNVEEHSDGTYLTFPAPPGAPEDMPRPSIMVASRDARRPIKRAWVGLTTDKVAEYTITHPRAASVYMTATDEDQPQHRDAAVQTDRPPQEQEQDPEPTKEEMEYLFPNIEDEELDSEEQQEKRTFNNLQHLLHLENRYVLPRRTGPCTIISNTAVEYPPGSSSSYSRTFLLRDAQLYKRHGNIFGHMIVRIIPYTDTDSLDLRRPDLRGCEEILISAATVKDRVRQGLRWESNPFIAVKPVIFQARVNGHMVTCMADTGSQGNCIGKDLWIKLGGSITFTANQTTIVGLAGQRTNCIGAWLTRVQLGNVSAPTVFFVLENMPAPVLLGRPWQKYNKMCLTESDEGTMIGIQSQDGRRTHTMLITSETEQDKAWSTVPAVYAPAFLDDVPTYDFSEHHKISELMDEPEASTSSQPKRKRESASPTTSPPPRRRLRRGKQKETPPVVFATTSSSPPEIEPHQREDEDMELLNIEARVPDGDPWDVDITLPETVIRSQQNIENDLYRKLMDWYCDTLGHRRAKEPKALDQVEVYETDQLIDFPRLHFNKAEDQFLLRNVLVRVGGEYREGHGVLDLFYFPHKTQRVIDAERRQQQAQGSTESLVLDEPPVEGPVRSNLEGVTINDFIQSEMEVAFEAQRARTTTPDESEQQRSPLQRSQTLPTQLHMAHVILRYHHSDSPATAAVLQQYPRWTAWVHTWHRIRRWTKEVIAGIKRSCRLAG